MMSETQAGTLAVLSIVLAAVSAAALAQYSASDPRSTIYNNESLRREDEIKRNEEAARRQSDQGQSGAGASVGTQYNPARDAQTHAAFKAARARLLKMAPLPDDRNPLLGRWRVESRVMAGSRNDMQLLMGMLSNPGGAACEITFGGGITEFRPKSWASIDGSGNDSLGPIAYRADGKRLWAIPDKGIELIGFEVANPNRVVVVNLEGCALVRVGSAAPAAQSGPSNRAPASSKTGAPPPIASVTPAPPPSTPSRPPAEVCRNTLLDKLGTVGVDQVRAMAKVRFTEAAIEGKVPNTDNLRLDLRGSACGEDPRVKASLYDFDANGMLQSITYVWDRPPGPAPAPIFQERVTTLSRFHRLPPPQSPGRLQADTSLGRLVLQDMPERNLLLEAYAAKK